MGIAWFTHEPVSRASCADDIQSDHNTPAQPSAVGSQSQLNFGSVLAPDFCSVTGEAPALAIPAWLPAPGEAVTDVR